MHKHDDLIRHELRRQAARDRALESGRHPEMLCATQMIGFGAGGTPLATAIWNAGDKGANVTISNGDLSASYSTYVDSSVRANIGKNSGKWYWEVRIDARSATSIINIGVAQTPLPQGSTCLYLAPGVWRAWNGSSYLVAAGDVLGFKFDASGGTGSLEVLKNNGTQTTITGLSLASVWYPAFSDDNGGATITCTANFGGSNFAYAVPSTFSAGLF